jgi:unsaturated rhamnogalacturonyl hydrolase
MLSTYDVTGEKRYFNYVKKWVDAMLGDDGIPKDMLTNEPDDLQPGVLLFRLYDETGDEKYKTLLDKLAGWMTALKTNPLGGIWHKDFLEDQMWLDSMYMAGVFTSRYAEKYGNGEHRKFVRRQMELMRKYAKDEKTGLYYHGWDYSKKAKWADPVTGRSANFWGRAMGWFAVSMFEIARTLKRGTEEYEDYVKTGLELIDSLRRYRDERTGMWYQVVDKGDLEGNWIETSCSCLFLYAICLAAELGEIGKEAIRPIAEHSFKSITDYLNRGDDGYIGVKGVCIGTGINDGTYEHYIARPTVENDLHGAGAFLLMCCEYAKVFE